MKNTVIKLLSVFAFAVAFTSCEQDKIVYNVDGGQSLVGFNSSSVSLLAFTDAERPAGYDNSTTIEVGSTKRSNVDRSYTVTINDEFTTAVPAQYQVNSTYKIPAGEFLGTIKVTGFYDALPSDWSSTILVLDLEEVSETPEPIYNPEKKRMVVTLSRGCIQTPAAKYTGYITSSVGGGAAPFDVNLTPVAGVFNTWNADNLWGDLVAAATNNSAYAGRYPYSAQIKINCNNSVNVYGTLDYTTVDGNSGTYRPATKEMSLSFGQALFSSPTFTTTVDLYPNP